MIQSVPSGTQNCSIELEAMRLHSAIIVPFCCVLKHFVVYVINCTLAKGEKIISFFLCGSVAAYSPQMFDSNFIYNNFSHSNVQINEKCNERHDSKFHITNYISLKSVKVLKQILKA